MNNANREPLSSSPRENRPDQNWNLVESNGKLGLVDPAHPEQSAITIEFPAYLASARGRSELASLPLIRAMHVANKNHAEIIRQAIENGGRDNIQGVMKAIESTDAIEYTAHKAREEADLALNALQNIAESEYKEALVNLAEFSVNRSY